MAGRTLIIQAQIQSVITEEVKLQNAVATFKGKYDCLPGDCGNASNWGFTSVRINNATGPVNGDNNGIIGALDGFLAGYNAPYSATPGNEPVMFWRELFQAGLIDASPTTGNYHLVTHPILFLPIYAAIVGG